MDFKNRYVTWFVPFCQVYVPFTFVKNYLELIGSFVGDQNEKVVI